MFSVMVVIALCFPAQAYIEVLQPEKDKAHPDVFAAVSCLMQCYHTPYCTEVNLGAGGACQAGEGAAAAGGLGAAKMDCTDEADSPSSLPLHTSADTEQKILRVTKQTGVRVSEALKKFFKCLQECEEDSGCTHVVTTGTTDSSFSCSGQGGPVEGAEMVKKDQCVDETGSTPRSPSPASTPPMVSKYAGFVRSVLPTGDATFVYTNATAVEAGTVRKEWSVSQKLTIFVSMGCRLDIKFSNETWISYEATSGSKILRDLQGLSDVRGYCNL